MKGSRKSLAVMLALSQFSNAIQKAVGFDPKKRPFSNQSKGFVPKKIEGKFIYPHHDKSGLSRALRRVMSQKKRSKYNTVINRMKQRGVKIPDVYFTKPRAVRLSQKA